MNRAFTLLVVVAAAACTREPQPVIMLSAPAAPGPMDATLPASPKRPQGPIDLAPHAPVSKPPPARVGAPVPATPAPAPDMVRDLRPTRVNVAAALIPDVQGYVSLLSTMPRTSPDRPRWMLRAAEDYAEMERVEVRDPARAKFADALRRAAIYYYQMLVNDYPKWCAAPDAADPAKSTGCADETLYYLAMEQERDGDITAARGTYSVVLRDWPSSRFIPSAHLAFGEFFLAESETDPSKLRLAEQSYLNALKYPPPGNVVYGYAQLQLGHVHLKKYRPRQRGEGVPGRDYVGRRVPISLRWRVGGGGGEGSAGVDRDALKRQPIWSACAKTSPSPRFIGQCRRTPAS